jgi:uncharacterized membrane protein (DUF373 family)
MELTDSLKYVFRALSPALSKSKIEVIETALISIIRQVYFYHGKNR